MIEPEGYQQLKQEIMASIEADRGLLDQLREEIRLLGNEVRRIYPDAIPNCGSSALPVLTYNP